MTDDEMEAMLKQLSDKVFASIPTTVYSSTSERKAALEAEARIVAWLLDVAQDCALAGRQRESAGLRAAADAIERGEHRREETR